MIRQTLSGGTLILSVLLIPGPAVATWSVVVADVRTKEVGIASVTCLTGFDLRAWTPVVLVNAGAGAAQDLVDVEGVRRITIRQGLEQGDPPAKIFADLEPLSEHQLRQYGIVDTHGRAFTFSGTANGPFAGGLPDECERAQFHRGDPNVSGTTDISDGISIFGFLFLGGATGLPCREAADANNDAAIDISDGIYILNWLFTGGPEPALPGPTTASCGFDSDAAGSSGDLGCEVYGPCE